MAITQKVQDLVQGMKDRVQGTTDEGLLATLKAEHREVAGLMDQISNSGEASRSKLFNKLYAKLWPHAKGEEDTLYPLLLRYDATREIAAEAVQEHAVVARLLNELKDMATHGDTWMAKFTVLQENVEHHVEEEEEEMFPKVRSTLSAADLARVAKEYEAARGRHAVGVVS